MSEDLTVKEEIMAELIISGRPLRVEEIAQKINRSRSAVNSNLTELRKSRRVDFLGKDIGWQARPEQPPGPVRGVGRI